MPVQRKHDDATLGRAVPRFARWTQPRTTGSGINPVASSRGQRRARLPRLLQRGTGLESPRIRRERQRVAGEKPTAVHARWESLPRIEPICKEFPNFFLRRSIVVTFLPCPRDRVLEAASPVAS